MATRDPASPPHTVGFAIPVDTVRRVVTQLIRYGRVQRPTLGLQVADDQIMRSIEAQLNTQLEGVMVTEVGQGCGGQLEGVIVTPLTHLPMHR